MRDNGLKSHVSYIDRYVEGTRCLLLNEMRHHAKTRNEQERWKCDAVECTKNKEEAQEAG